MADSRADGGVPAGMAEDVWDCACRGIEGEADVLNEISQQIWGFRELQFVETKSHATLTDFLERRGFHVQRSLVLDTAFLATWERRKQSTPADTSIPHVAFICEYDALPDIGHACGHNLIAEVGVGAALGVKAAMEKHGQIYGKISVIGTPAEEGGGGKIDLLDAGVFRGVDAALMVHPAPFSDARPVFLSGKRMAMDFQGKSAHAGGYPWEGVNALDAVVQAYVNVATLRQQLRPSSRVHVIITKGGTRTNIIPSEAQALAQVRGETDAECHDLEVKVKRCFRAAADATGCQLTITDSPKSYQSLVSNEVLARLYEKHAANVGFDLPSPFPKKVLGSTDMGNVSHVTASLHPTYNCNTQAVNHTPEFTQAAGSSQAQKPTLAQAQILACIALELFMEPHLVRDIHRHFVNDMASQ